MRNWIVWNRIAFDFETVYIIVYIIFFNTKAYFILRMTNI